MRNEKQSDFSQAIIQKGYQIERQLAKKAGRRTLLARDVKSQELDIDGLEIVIPPQGFRLAQIALISLVSPFAIGFDLSDISRQLYSQEISDSAYLMKQIVQAFGILFILLIILWALFKRTRLKISKSSVSYIYEMIGIKWKFLQKKLIRNKYQLGLTHPNPQEISHQYAHLSLEEVECLAEEISDYLDTPISRV